MDGRPANKTCPHHVGVLLIMKKTYPGQFLKTSPAIWDGSDAFC